MSWASVIEKTKQNRAELATLRNEGSKQTAGAELRLSVACCNGSPNVCFF